MFAITSTRIVGLIAVVCAVVVAPQALAVPITDGATAAPTVVPPDAALGNDLSGFDLKAGFHPQTGFDPTAASRIAGYDLSGSDLSALNKIPGYEQQQEYLQFLARASIRQTRARASTRLKRPPQSRPQSRRFSVEALTWKRRTGSCIRTRTGRRFRSATRRQRGTPRPALTPPGTTRTSTRETCAP